MVRRQRRTGLLDDRARVILAAVVEEHIRTALPVGSIAISDGYDLGVSPATVRGVLVELEELGLLMQPHTSAGRVPTDLGYRTYAVEIAAPDEIAPVDQLMIRHQFGQAEGGADQWFRIAATTLASSSRAAGIATPIRPTLARLRHIDLVRTADRLATLIAVVSDGSVRPTLLPLPEGADQDALSAVASRLNATVLDKSAAQLAAAATSLPESLPHRAIVRTVLERTSRLLAEIDDAAVEQVYSDGLLNVMEAPEFAESSRVRNVFTALEGRGYLGNLVQEVSQGSEVRLFIGSENAPVEMHGVALILAPYGVPGQALGVVGVLGPTRMPYPRAVGSVQFVANLLSELVTRLHRA
jgi:heat-inducible transcriptional repressor